jgi:hypothetical protein
MPPTRALLAALAASAVIVLGGCGADDALEVNAQAARPPQGVLPSRHQAPHVGA